jgi:hypothetical protein
VWEGELRDNLENMDDEWKCHHSPGAMFTVNSIFGFLSDSISPPPVPLNVEKLSLLEQLWKSKAPSKVIVFSWQLLFGRLPTKGNLFKREIFSDTRQSDCTWCPLITESEGHLFGMCPFACGLWYKVLKWLRLIMPVHPDPFMAM